MGFNLDPNLIAKEREYKEAPGEWSPFDIETGYIGEHRYVVRTIGLPHLEVSAYSEWFEKIKTSERRDGVWLLVGGLRGLTNANFFALAKEIRPKKIWLVASREIEFVDEKLLGATEEDLDSLRREMTRESLRMKVSPTKRWNEFHRNLECSRNLKAFKDLGIEIEFRACNMRFTEQIRTLVREIEAVGDRITFFVSGAGRVEHVNAIELTNQPQAVDCVLTKINGLNFFWDLLADHPLRVVVIFGSVAGRFGGNGQISYSGHNDICAKLIHAWRRFKSDCRFLCVEWGPWGDVGMAARPDVKGAIASANILFITKETGVPLFLKEFHAGLPEPEILFVSWKYYDRFQPKVTSNPKHVLSNKNEPLCGCGERKKLAVIDGDSWEARKLRDNVGKTPLEEANIFIITQPREYGAIKAKGEARVDARNVALENVMQRVCEWRDARRDARDDALVVLGISDLIEQGERDEGEEYFARVSELEESGDYGQFEIAFLSVPIDVALKWDIVDSMLSEARAKAVEEKETEESSDVPVSESRPLVQRVSNDSDQIVAALEPDPNVAPYLLHHQLKRTPILPFVIALEAFAETVADETSSRKLWTFGSIKAVNGLRFTQHRPYRLRTIAKRNESNNWNIKLVGERLNARGETINDSFPYVTGSVSYSSVSDGVGIAPPAAPIDLTNAVEWVPDYPTINDNGFYHGPALQKLRRCHFMSEKEAIGELTSPDLSELLGNESKCATLDAALLDAAFWCCGALNCFSRPDKSVIPESLGLLVGTSRLIEPNEKCLVHTLVCERKTLPMGYTQVVFDFVIYNAKGTPVWRANGFRMTEF